MAALFKPTIMYLTAQRVKLNNAAIGEDYSLTLID
jgi:hypothetical protein